MEKPLPYSIRFEGCPLGQERTVAALQAFYAEVLASDPRFDLRGKPGSLLLRTSLAPGHEIGAIVLWLVRGHFERMRGLEIAFRAALLDTDAVAGPGLLLSVCERYCLSAGQVRERAGLLVQENQQYQILGDTLVCKPQVSPGYLEPIFYWLISAFSSLSGSCHVEEG